jgi:hypothetical protein
MAFRYGPGPILDAFPGAQAAYSLRLLRSTYTGSCLTVRRSSDNATRNIGFYRYTVDTQAILDFVGSGNGFVTTWFDQSTNAVNLSQGTAASQFNIVTSGSLHYEGNDLVMNAATNRAFSRGTNTTTLGDWTVYIKAKVTNNSSYIGGNTGLMTSIAAGGVNATAFRQPSDNTYKTVITGFDSTYRKIQIRRTSATGTLLGFQNGIPNTTSTTTDGLTLSSGTAIFGNFAGGGYVGAIREMLIYPVTHDNFTIGQINNTM